MKHLFCKHKNKVEMHIDYQDRYFIYQCNDCGKKIWINMDDMPARKRDYTSGWLWLAYLAAVAALVILMNSCAPTQHIPGSDRLWQKESMRCPA